jgi:membrane fusion protein, copper/silver efflux system
MKKKLRNKAHHPTTPRLRRTCRRTRHQAGAIALVILVLLLTGCNRNNHTAHDSEQYTCSMHPQIVKDAPGICPICGMELVPKAQPGQEVKITSALNYLLKPTNAVVTSSIKTVFTVRKSMELVIEATGMIKHDTRKIATISSRFGGRIEKLYVNYNFQPIVKGQKLLDIYSPELVTAQRELLYLLDKDPENFGMIGSVREKLKLLGVSENQVSQISSSRKESYSFAVFSPVNGYIMDHFESGSDGLMPVNSGQPAEGPSGLKVREGMYVTTGETLFTVVNHADLWAEFDLHANDAAGIKLNDIVRITVDDSPNEVAGSKVSFVQPFIKDRASFTKVRAYLYNPHQHYHAGQLITATFTTKSDSAWWIPVNARLDLGTQKIAFVKNHGVFRPKVISTGRHTADWIEVVDGLEPHDSIAYNAQFLTDSESFIKVNQTN